MSAATKNESLSCFTIISGFFVASTAGGVVTLYAFGISYLAFARFGWDPELSWDRFMDQDVAPLFGGRTEADAPAANPAAR